MKDPKKLSNDDLALHLDFWTVLQETELTDRQKEFFKEIVWRLRLAADKEQENIDGQR